MRKVELSRKIVLYLNGQIFQSVSELFSAMQKQDNSVQYEDVISALHDLHKDEIITVTQDPRNSCASLVQLNRGNPLLKGIVAALQF